MFDSKSLLTQKHTINQKHKLLNSTTNILTNSKSVFQARNQREVSQPVLVVGRQPDLRPEHALQLARDLHARLHRRLLYLFAGIQNVRTEANFRINLLHDVLLFLTSRSQLYSSNNFGKSYVLSPNLLLQRQLLSRVYFVSQGDYVFLKQTEQFGVKLKFEKNRYRQFFI